MGADLEDPDLVTRVTAYVTAAGQYPTGTALAEALAAEAGDQANRCRVPAEHADYIATPLLEALCRRVAHNLAVRPLPLGVQQLVSDAGAATTSVGGHDAEVRRLEAPYRRRPVG